VARSLQITCTIVVIGCHVCPVVRGTGRLLRRRWVLSEVAYPILPLSGETELGRRAHGHRASPLKSVNASSPAGQLLRRGFHRIRVPGGRLKVLRHALAKERGIYEQHWHRIVNPHLPKSAPQSRPTTATVALDPKTHVQCNGRTKSRYCTPAR
jgi:hypothetical protein